MGLVFDGTEGWEANLATATGKLQAYVVVQEGGKAGGKEAVIVLQMKLATRKEQKI